MKILVNCPGLLDLVQDLGRPGYRQFGVPEGGAADREALILANRLVGNDVGLAGLEFALQGPELLFPDGGAVALTGARFDVRCAGRPVNRNETVELQAGAILEIGRVIDGCRGYLAVAGGIALTPVLGSHSTFLPSGFGGLEGRTLRAGDELPVRPGRQPRKGRAAEIRETQAIRVVAGPQLNLFTEAALLKLFSGSYTIGVRSDRTGICLAGPKLDTSAHTNLPSQGVLPGAIQVPPDGLPIILGWDGPVTGGYPVIAGVIAADLGRIAQLKPGDRISFVAIGPEDARLVWEERQSIMNGSIAWLA